jgi:hypothetical protein
MVREAESRLRAAEGRIMGLRYKLAVIQAELGESDAQIQDLSTQIEAFRPLEQLPSIDRPAPFPKAATEDSSDKRSVAKLDCAMGHEGNGQRPRRRSPRARPAKAGTVASSELIEIPDHARAQ